ncbi:uncharacterized protein N0V89_009111 [Didymosphaeria variabile]|uniref:Metallo-beta-lactamase domain-containing protein n=1 Tax=Didymosphaeria variabile TaxID=1932322 RepID=A0A9W8XH79_9PLEO|nr:uncharacterized protein N0V89_009111 [Didymosphaeria variabile]KAJ4350490.1 hypothetical protein N0V89_009111 [Didymosphaeria variabile]
MLDTMTQEPQVHSVFEPVTGTWQYIVADPNTNEAVIIDPVLDYDKSSGTISTRSADELLDLVTNHEYKIQRILETHAHADHLTASRYLQTVLSQKQTATIRPLVCIGKRIKDVQQTMQRKFNIPESELEDAFDHLFDDDETFNIGGLTASVIHLPGHTPDHIGYVIGSNVFTGDSIFNPDVGSARCDFPGGSAVQLYNSTQRLLQLPPHFRLYTGHDYPPDSRDPHLEQAVDGAVPYTTVETQRRENKHVKAGTKLEEFVNWRTERDSGLAEPKLLRQAMQVNVRGGRLPAKSTDDFKIANVPLHVFQVAG